MDGHDSTSHEELILDGVVFHAEMSPTSVLAAGNLDVGFTTGPIPIVAMDRLYYTSGSDMKVVLYRASYTGGTAFPRHANRNALSSRRPPLTIKYGVTPGTLGDPVVELNFSAASPAGRISVSGEDNTFVLAHNTSYVLRLTNTDSNAKNLSFAFDYRELDVNHYNINGPGGTIQGG